MKPNLSAVFSILCGLATAQTVATFHVHAADFRLAASIRALDSADYLVVPNLNVLPALLSWKTAFCGGLFFTLSVGSCLALLAWLAAWLRPDRKTGSRRYMTAWAGAWAILVIAANQNGFNFFASAYFVLVPAAVLAASAAVGPCRPAGLKPKDLIIRLALLAAMGMLASPFVQGDIFLRIRDKILLQNPFGRCLNDFYYRYTLHPAQSFKSLEQKLIKSCRLSAAPVSETRTRLEPLLLQHDYLIDDQSGYTDLHLMVDAESRAAFFHHGRKGFECDLDEFLADPVNVLAAFSDAVDRWAFLRSFTLVGIFTTITAAFIVVIYGPLSALLRCFWSGGTASVVAGLLCFGLLMTGIAWLNQDELPNTDAATFDQPLGVMKPRQQAAVLKSAVHRRMDLGTVLLDDRLKTECVVVRYWLARALAFSRDPSSRDRLLALARDPQVNVACMALHALGRRGDSGVIPEIQRILRGSGRWYVQGYAYRALRRLGWRQTRFR